MLKETVILLNKLKLFLSKWSFLGWQITKIDIYSVSEGLHLQNVLTHAPKLLNQFAAMTSLHKF